MDNICILPRRFIGDEFGRRCQVSFDRGSPVKFRCCCGSAEVQRSDAPPYLSILRILQHYCRTCTRR